MLSGSFYLQNTLRKTSEVLGNQYYFSSYPTVLIWTRINIDFHGFFCFFTEKSAFAVFVRVRKKSFQHKCRATNF